MPSMVMAKPAARAGVTRSSLGMKSRVTTRPPGASAARSFRSSASFVGGSKWCKKVRDQNDVVARAEIHVERAARQAMNARFDARRARIFLGHFEHAGPVQRENFRVRVVLRDGDAEHAVARGEIEHFPFLARCRRRIRGRHLFGHRRASSAPWTARTRPRRDFPARPSLRPASAGWPVRIASARS